MSDIGLLGKIVSLAQPWVGARFDVMEAAITRLPLAFTEAHNGEGYEDYDLMKFDS